MSYDNTNRAAIWKNDRKETENHPDFKGEGNVNGVDYWVSAWKRKAGGSPNSPALTFSFQPKNAAKQKPQAQKPEPEEIDDDIPF